MRRNSRLTLWFSLAALAATIGICVWGATIALRQPKVRLPDGTVLTYQEMTYGLTHRWVPKAWWERLLGPVAPKGSRAAYATHFYPEPNEKPYLVAWFTAPPPKPRSVTGWKNRICFVADENGREYAECQVMWQFLAGNQVIEYARVPVPSSGDRVELHFYDKVGDFASPLTLSLPAEALRSRIAPPAEAEQGSTVPHPKAVAAQPAPITVVKDGLQVELSEATTGISGGGRNSSRPEVLLAKTPRKAGVGELPWTRLAVRFPTQSQGWLLVSATAADGAGRNASQSYLVHRRSLSWSALPGFLALEGQPLSVSLLLEKRSEDYPAAEKWVITNLRVPAYAQQTMIGQTRQIQGARLTVRALAAKGTTTGPGRGDLEVQPYFRILADLPRDRIMSVWTVDDRGRRADSPLDFAGSGAPYEFRIRINLAPDARQVALHLAVHPPAKRKIVELLVKPTCP